MRYLLRRDTIFATVAVFLFIGIISLLPINTGLLNPIKIALADFDYNDIAYSELNKNANTPFDSRIVIVNIGKGDRAEIAGIIERINAAKPSVIGLDVRFEGPRDEDKDWLLRLALSKANNLVACTKINWSDKKNPEKPGFFAVNITKKGYANFIGEDRGTIRYFSPLEKNGADTYLSFAAAIVKENNPKQYEKLLSRHHPAETINYSRKINQYMVVDGMDVLTGQTADELLKNKIVLLGFVNDDMNDIEDKHLTPFNKKFAGKATPDMNGVVIHANIISMILDGKYINKVPGWLNWIITILIAWVNVAFFVKYFVDSHIWFHLAAKIVQLLSFIFFVYLSIVFYDKFSIRFDVKIASFAILLAVDIIYFYEALAVWLHQKHNFKTIFYKPHH